MLPKKKLATIQAIICFAVAILLLVFAFLPLVSINIRTVGVVDENMIEVVGAAAMKDPENAEKYQKILATFAEEDSFLGESSVSMSAIDFIVGIPGTLSIIKYAFPTDDNGWGAFEVDPSSVTYGSVTTTRVLVSVIAGFFDMEEMNIADILTLVTRFFVELFKVILLIGVLIVIPIQFIIKAIIIAVKFLKNVKTPDAALPEISPIILDLVVACSTILATVFLWSASFTPVGIVMLVAICIAVVANLVASRMKKYSENEFKYLNIMQITSAVSIIGMVIFLVFLSKADIVGFLSNFTDYGEAVSKGEGYLIAMVMVLAVVALYALVMLISGANGIAAKAAQLSCSGDEKKILKNNKSSVAISCVVLMVLTIIAFAVFGVKFDHNTEIYVALVGAIIAVAADAVCASMGSKLLSKEEITAIQCGAPLSRLDEEEAPVAEAAPAAEEAAPAAESAPAAEEAPAEETTPNE